MSVFAASAVSAANSCQPVPSVQPTPASQCRQRRQCTQLLPSVPSVQPPTAALLQGQAQTHLCARFARADGGTAAVALHPADNGVAHPVAVWVYGV